jgi:hypothetical protein
VRKTFKYGVVQYNGAKAGDPVRFVDAPGPGKTGAILAPRAQHEINAILIRVEGSLGYAEIKPRLPSASAVAESGSAGGVRIGLPVTVGGSLKIS